MKEGITTHESANSRFFPDNIQFWYETKRAFGASSYGGGEFGEVIATVYRIKGAILITGMRSGMPPPRACTRKRITAPSIYGRVLQISEDITLKWQLLVRETGHTFSPPDRTIAATAITTLLQPLLVIEVIMTKHV